MLTRGLKRNSCDHLALTKDKRDGREGEREGLSCPVSLSAV